MDEERMPKELVNKMLIAILIITIQAILLSHFRKAGLIFIFGIFLFLLMFSIKDKRLKKQSENKILTQRDWYKSKYKLTKEIP